MRTDFNYKLTAKEICLMFCKEISECHIITCDLEFEKWMFLNIDKTIDLRNNIEIKRFNC